MNFHKIILLIGSNPNWLDETIFMLEHSEHIVLFADNGKEGIRIAQCDHPDLIISELKLPDISGINLCQIIRSDKELSSVPVILVNERQQAIDEVIKELQAGVNDLLTICCNPEYPPAKNTWLLGRKQSETYPELSREALYFQQHHLTKIIKDISELITVFNFDPWFNNFDKTRNEYFDNKADRRIELGINVIDGLNRLLEEQSNNLDVLVRALSVEEFKIPYKAIKHKNILKYREDTYTSKDIFQTDVLNF